MADPKEPTRAELAEALLQSNALLKEQAAVIAELRAKPDTSSEVQLQILQALKDLKASARPQASAFYTGPKISTIPYRGWVKALQACQVNHPNADGSPGVHVHQEGDVFEIDVPSLWTDDPYMAVIITGYEDQAQLKPITVKNEDAPTPANFQFRRQVELDEKPTLRRASEY